MDDQHRLVKVFKNYEHRSKLLQKIFLFIHLDDEDDSRSENLKRDRSDEESEWKSTTCNAAFATMWGVVVGDDFTEALSTVKISVFA